MLDIGLVLQFLKDKWYLVVMAVLLAIIGFLKFSNLSLEVELAEAKTKYEQLNTEFEKLTILTNNCNNKVTELNTLYKNTNLKLEDSKKKIASITAENTILMDNIRVASVPKTCEGAMGYLVPAMQNMAKDWSQ